MIRRARLAALAPLIRFELPIAWAMLVGYAAAFVAVALNLVATGQFRLVTLLVALGLVHDGLDAVRSAEPALGESADQETQGPPQDTRGA